MCSSLRIRYVHHDEGVEYIEYTHTSQHHKTPNQHNISDQIIMSNVATKQKKNGKSDHDGTSRRGRYARGTVAAELPEVPLVVTPETTSCACVSTASSLEPSPRKLSSQLTTQTANLSTAFYAESSASIKKSTSSGVKKIAKFIDFCDST
jgi:hypothetical protein